MSAPCKLIHFSPLSVAKKSNKKNSWWERLWARLSKKKKNPEDDDIPLDEMPDNLYVFPGNSNHTNDENNEQPVEAEDCLITYLERVSKDDEEFIGPIKDDCISIILDTLELNPTDEQTVDEVQAEILEAETLYDVVDKELRYWKIFMKEEELNAWDGQTLFRAYERLQEQAWLINEGEKANKLVSLRNFRKRQESDDSSTISESEDKPAKQLMFPEKDIDREISLYLQERYGFDEDDDVVLWMYLVISYRMMRLAKFKRLAAKHLLPDGSTNWDTKLRLNWLRKIFSWWPYQNWKAVNEDLRKKNK